MEKVLQHRVVKAIVAVVVAVAVGTTGFWIINDGRSSIGECLYMTIITLSTVGYGEVIPLDGAGRAFACFLILFGMSTLVYFGTTVIAFWVELDMLQVRRRKMMQKDIDNLSNHIIVCGVGTTGSHVVRELISSRSSFVIVESNKERIDAFMMSFEDEDESAKGILYIHGDATDDRTLHRAGIDRAQGLVSALPNDKDNLYIILSARQMNKDLRIVARAIEEDAPHKMLRAGANRVVSPNLIGGMRIASEMVRPQVVEFLDMMLKDQDQATRIEQVQLPPNSPLVGKKLQDTNIRKATDVLVIAMRDKGGDYIFNPGPDTVLSDETTLVVLGTIDSVIKLRRSLGGHQQSSSLIIQ